MSVCCLSQAGARPSSLALFRVAEILQGSLHPVGLSFALAYNPHMYVVGRRSQGDKP
jgi:hypothetical protein